MICPFMSFHGNNDLKECEKENCALYGNALNACTFLIQQATIMELINTFKETTYKTPMGNRIFQVSK